MIRRDLLRAIALAGALTLATGLPAWSAIDVVPPASGGGTDGVLDPSADDSICVGGLQGGVCTIDLTQAACDCSVSPPGARTVCPAEGSPDRCAWDGTNPSDDDPSMNVGNGVYDGEKWAVVFRFSSINIQSGVTVNFTNHPSRAPVVWLVDGSITIDGTVGVDGGDQTGAALTPAVPGPGGFHGGRPTSGAGFGPGGGGHGAHGAGGSYGSQGGSGSTTYGNGANLPLIGGSGGGGSTDVWGGGAGGGAILLAADDTITVTGLVSAFGGAGHHNVFGNPTSGGGSGGAIRLVADVVTDVMDDLGPGMLRAWGGGPRGGSGRIRVEANTFDLTDLGAPIAETGTPSLIFPAANAPAVAITEITYDNGTVVPTGDPQGDLRLGLQDLTLADDNTITIEVTATNVPAPPDPDAWAVTVIATPLEGDRMAFPAAYSSGDSFGSIWTADITLPNGLAALQVRASAQ